MSKPASAPRELCPEGTHAAVCTGVIDYGTQIVEFNGSEKKQKKISIEFEPQGVEKEAGGRFLIAARLTNSSDDRSTLAKILKAWGFKNPADVDLETLVGKPAMITVTHSDDGQYANIGTVSAPPKGMKVGKPVQALRSLFLDETFDEDVFNGLSDKAKEKIMASPEYEECTTPKVAKKKGKK